MSLRFAAPSIRSVRDLTVLDRPDGQLVVACDSVGGIGPKPADTFPAPASTTAHFATRVPLLEVLCAGAQPLVIVNALCVEKDPQGTEMIAAVRDLAAQAGVPAEGVTGSTEDNVATRATGIGVTVIGEVTADGLRAGRSVAGDVVLCAGMPLSAPHDSVYPGHPDQVAIDDLRTVLGLGLIHDALPVGSKGLAWEVPNLATPAGLVAHWRDETPVPRDRSAGPSSCVLLTCHANDEQAVRAAFPDTLPLHVVADLRKPE